MGLFSRKKSILDTTILQNATDRHSHILYGVDDGVASQEEALQILEFYQQQGLKDLWLTPHVMEDIPNSTEKLKVRFKELMAAYVPEGESGTDHVRLHLAAEYMLDPLFASRLDQGDLLTMEDNMVLVETSTWSPPMDLYEIFDRMMRKGYRPLFAHVERYHYLKPEDYDRIHKMGVRMQLNVGSLTGGYGENSQKRAHILLDKSYYHCCGSDCHRFKNIYSQYSAKELDKDDLAALESLFHQS